MKGEPQEDNEYQEDMEFDENLEMVPEESDVEESMMMENDLETLFQTFFMEDKKERNMVDVLLEVRRSLDTTNKIMFKMLGILEKHFTRQ